MTFLNYFQIGTFFEPQQVNAVDSLCQFHEDSIFETPPLSISSALLTEDPACILDLPSDTQVLPAETQLLDVSVLEPTSESPSSPIILHDSFAIPSELNLDLLNSVPVVSLNLDLLHFSIEDLKLLHSYASFNWDVDYFAKLGFRV